MTLLGRVMNALLRRPRCALIATTVWLPCANLHIRRPLAQQDEAFYPSPVQNPSRPAPPFLLKAGLSFFGKAGLLSSLDATSFGRP